MSERDEALALLRERFPEPWDAYISKRGGATTYNSQWEAHALYPHTHLGSIHVDGLGHTPVAAARACVAAWDEATDDMWGKAAAYAGVVESRDAERELSDRLAEALAAAGNCGNKPCVKCLDRIGAALSAWRERRGK